MRVQARSLRRGAAGRRGRVPSGACCRPPRAEVDLSEAHLPPIGLLVNFNVTVLRLGVRRLPNDQARNRQRPRTAETGARRAARCCEINCSPESAAGPADLRRGPPAPPAMGTRPNQASLHRHAEPDRSDARRRRECPNGGWGADGRPEPCASGRVASSKLGPDALLHDAPGRSRKLSLDIDTQRVLRDAPAERGSGRELARLWDVSAATISRWRRRLTNS